MTILLLLLALIGLRMPWQGWVLATAIFAVVDINVLYERYLKRRFGHNPKNWQ